MLRVSVDLSVVMVSSSVTNSVILELTSQLDASSAKSLEDGTAQELLQSAETQLPLLPQLLLLLAHPHLLPPLLLLLQAQFWF